MYPDTYEQVEVPSAIFGPGERFLQPGMQLPVEFFENEPIGVVFPEIAEVRVTETSPPVHWQQDGAWKEQSWKTASPFASLCSLPAGKLCESRSRHVVTSKGCVPSVSAPPERYPLWEEWRRACSK